MKRWRLNTLLLIAIFATCLVTISANDDDDDDGVTVEAEKIVIVQHNLQTKIMFLFFCVNILHSFVQFIGEPKTRL